MSGLDVTMQPMPGDWSRLEEASTDDSAVECSEDNIQVTCVAGAINRSWEK
jgi:hypothetical protein